METCSNFFKIGQPVRFPKILVMLNNGGKFCIDDQPLIFSSETVSLVNK